MEQSENCGVDGDGSFDYSDFLNSPLPSNSDRAFHIRTAPPSIWGTSGGLEPPFVLPTRHIWCHLCASVGLPLEGPHPQKTSGLVRTVPPVVRCTSDFIQSAVQGGRQLSCFGDYCFGRLFLVPEREVTRAIEPHFAGLDSVPRFEISVRSPGFPPGLRRGLGRSQHRASFDERGLD